MHSSAILVTLSSLFLFVSVQGNPIQAVPAVPIPRNPGAPAVKPTPSTPNPPKPAAPLPVGPYELLPGQSYIVNNELQRDAVQRRNVLPISIRNIRSNARTTCAVNFNSMTEGTVSDFGSY